MQQGLGKAINFIRREMKLSEAVDFMATTNDKMYSTLTATVPRRRYYQTNRSTSFKKSVLQKSAQIQPPHLAATFTKDMRRDVKTPQLPEIKRRRGVIMEEWINNALEKDGTEVSSPEQPLKTLKKYQFDKATLRNLNLSHQAINKLYSGLYVYTEGLKNMFTEMLAETAAMPRQDNFLPKKYFQVFLKLLENAMPLKSSYKITEETRLKEIMELKRDKGRLLEKQDELYQQLEIVETKWQKKYEELQTKMRQFMKEYKILETTLQMYQTNFNDEVFLRLKFQQKINQAYTCYEELRVKYEDMKTELGGNREVIAGQFMNHKEMKDKLQTEIIKNGDLEKEIVFLGEKIKELEGDIVVKNQEILDIKLMNNSEQDKKVDQEDVLDQLLMTIKNLKKQKSDGESKISEQNQTISTHIKTINRLKGDLSSAREKNDDLYIKCHDTTVKIIPLQNQLHEKSLEIVSVKKSNVELKVSQEAAVEELVVEQGKVAQMSQEITNLKKINVNLEKEYEKIKGSISSLKEVKDKYERINLKLQEELKIEREEIQKKIKEITSMNTQKVDLEFHMAQIKRQGTAYEEEISRLEKNLFGKDKELDESIAEGKKKVRIVEDKVKAKELEIHNHKMMYQKVISESSRKDTEKINKLEEISYLKKVSQQQENELKQAKTKVNQLAVDLQRRQKEIQTLSKKLANRQFTISKKKHEVDGQIINMRTAIVNLKQTMYDKGQHVHPMIVQDMTEQINRLHAKIDRINGENQYVNNNFKAMEEELKIRRGQVNSSADQLLKLNQSVSFYCKEIQKYKGEKKELETKVRELEWEKKKASKEFNAQKELLGKKISKKEEQLFYQTQKSTHISADLSKCKEQLRIALIKPKVTTEQQQTDPIEPEKPPVKETNEAESQTDVIQEHTKSNGSGQKLTTTQKLRGKKDEEGGILPPKKVEQKQFKTALKLTYMRK